MTRNQVYKSMTLGERIKLRAMQKQQGVQWRVTVRQFWATHPEPRVTYWGTETPVKLMEKLRVLCDGDADKLPLL